MLPSSGIDKQTPSDPRAWRKKGDDLFERKQYEEAIVCYDKAIGVNPTLFKWESCQKGIALTKLRKYNEAIETFDSLLKIDPKSQRAWCYKGIALGKIAKHEDAIRCYDVAIRIDQKYSRAWFQKGVLLGKLGKHDEAVKCLDNTISIDPKDKQARLEKGIRLVALGKFNEAVACYDVLLKMNPNDTRVWIDKGVALAKQSNYTEAIECYKKAIIIDPKYYHAWYNMARALYRVGNFSDAVDCYDNILKIRRRNGENTEYYQDALYYKGFTLIEFGKFDEAVQCFTQILKNNTHLYAWCNMGLIQDLKGNLEEAAVWYEKANRIDSSLATKWYNGDDIKKYHKVCSLGSVIIFPKTYQQPQMDAHEAARQLMGEKWSDDMKNVVTEFLSIQNIIEVQENYKLTHDETASIIYFTTDESAFGVDTNVYKTLNNQLYLRQVLDNSKPFVYYLLSGLSKLPNFEGTLFSTPKPSTHQSVNSLVWVTFTKCTNNVPEKISDHHTRVQIKVFEAKDVSMFGKLDEAKGNFLLIPNCYFQETTTLVFQQIPTPDVVKKSMLF